MTPLVHFHFIQTTVQNAPVPHGRSDCDLLTLKTVNFHNAKPQLAAYESESNNNLARSWVTQYCHWPNSNFLEYSELGLNKLVVVPGFGGLERSFTKRTFG